MDRDRLDRLVNASERFENFDLYTSCEAYGRSAEFIRSGLNYDLWLANLRDFANRAQYRNINIMLTISSLVMFSITDFLDDMIDLKREYASRPGLFSLSVNILRFPSFQSINLLPEHIKNVSSTGFTGLVRYEIRIPKGSRNKSTTTLSGISA